MAKQTAGVDNLPTQATTKYKHLRDADKGLILQLAADKRTQQEIASIVGCSQSTVSELLSKVSAPAQVVQRLLKSHETDAVTHWASAAEKAAKRGDHRPARELIEMANPELRPQQGNSAGGVGVQVIIGMPGSPVQLPVIEAKATFRPLEIAESESETGQLND